MRHRPVLPPVAALALLVVTACSDAPPDRARKRVVV